MANSELNLDSISQATDGVMPSADGAPQTVDGKQMESVDLSAVSFSDSNTSEVEGNTNQSMDVQEVKNIDGNALETMVGELDLGNDNNPESTLDQNVFTDASNTPKKQVDHDEKFGVYLRMFFISSAITVLGVIAIALMFSFSKYIKAASQNIVPVDDIQFVNTYKDKLATVKGRFGKDNVSNYSQPNSDSDTFQSDVDRIINASDIDYIDKKDLLTSPVSNLVHTAENNASEIEKLKQEIARQGFLPEEVKGILDNNQAIETIQRSMNALEVIKFSTAAKVFSYMSSTLSNIAEMVKMSGVNGQIVGEFLTQITSRGEKDINAYVNMCYLNPFEYDANCDVIGDLDLYYKSILKDDSIDIKLLKNVMNGMNQLLENEDSATFSITFNGFNAQDKDIMFNIEVFTNASDERALMSQGKKNPNIFILTNIVNLLKQSTFIIGAKIDMNSIDVQERTLTHGGFSTVVNYSSQDFTVPIQKDTEREIFDYIDIDKVVEIIDKLKDKSEDLEVENDENIINEGLPENYDTFENNEINNNEGDEIYQLEEGYQESATIEDQFASEESSNYDTQGFVNEEERNIAEEIDENIAVEELNITEESNL